MKRRKTLIEKLLAPIDFWWCVILVAIGSWVFDSSIFAGVIYCIICFLVYLRMVFVDTPILEKEEENGNS